ncbi:predicted protein, partial [Nematostella vectensis]
LLSNVRSLAPKIDEVREAISNANLDLACITETWLRNHIHNNVIAVSGYNLVRRDRTKDQHGGVCIFIKDSIKYQVLEDLMDDEFEVLWIQLRPSRLPRGITSIVVGLVYHPPSAADMPMLEYLHSCLSTMEASYPGCGTILLGDFNKTLVKKSTRLSNGFKLKQLVNFPTRGGNMLDPIFTNLGEFYNPPTQLPAFGMSDHFSVDRVQSSP